MHDAGFSVFAQLIELGVRGADLITDAARQRPRPRDQGTLRVGAIPRLRRARLRQMSAAWLDKEQPAVLEWG